MLIEFCFLVASSAQQSSVDLDWSQPVAKKEDELELNWDDEDNDEGKKDDVPDNGKITAEELPNKPEIRKAVSVSLSQILPDVWLNAWKIL
jgi:hypothetical protein